MNTIPSDLKRALTASPIIQKKWDDLTPIAQRDFITWIHSAKQSKTREGRIKKACDMLQVGKRRPCCYAVVPMGIYKALNLNPKAQSAWKSLTPDARRDFVDWIAEAKDPKTHEQRIEKICVMLKAGKRI